MRTADYDYLLPPERIAQGPCPQRDQSRLLVLRRPTGGGIEHRRFSELPEYLRPGDVLVLNDSKVIPARLHGTNRSTGGEFEVLLLEENVTNDWWAMMRPGKRARLETRLCFRDRAGAAAGIEGVVTEINAEGHRRLRFSGSSDIAQELTRLGQVPLPPYIKRPGGKSSLEDSDRYQTVYARAGGSIAAPTAGLHFTQALLEKLMQTGVHVCSLTLHVGLGTFAPVKSEMLASHQLHEERFSLSHETAAVINAAKREGRRVIAVGTTTVRVLETVAAEEGALQATPAGRTHLFIHPPYRFRIVNGLVTNFHLPCSTLLMLVSALAAPEKTSGRQLILSVYAEAIQRQYRFYSYGDAMLIL